MNKSYFEWDTDKNSKNKEKHGIAFEEDILIFDDPYLLEKYDISHSDDEDRFLAIGSIKGILIVPLAYTDRNGRTRIISARAATKKEKELYYDTINTYIGR